MDQSSPKNDSPEKAVNVDNFPATAWSALVVQEGKEEADGPQPGWEHLARSYWQPLYAFLRRQGLNHDVAADDIQGFFAYLLSRDFLRRIERGDGLFRSFLLASLKNWRIDQHRANSAKKRGDGVRPLALDDLEAIGVEPVEEKGSPEEALDRRWARSVYDNSLATLHQQLRKRGREPLFLALVGVFNGQDVAKYEEIATNLGMSVGAVKQAALEMRREFGKVLRSEVRRTVTEEAQVDNEIRYVLGLLRN